MNFTHPWGELVLERRPARKNERLLAFDTADRLALDHAAAEFPPEGILVVNDRFGALSLALGKRCGGTWSDSAVAIAALRRNAEINEVPSPEVLPAPAPDSRAVLMRVPKSLDLLAHQLSLLSQLPQGTPVVATAMVKHLPHRARDLMEEHLGPTDLSRAWKKARLLLSRVSRSGPAVAGKQRRDVDWELSLEALPGVFSAGKLDRGTRLLLGHLGELKVQGRMLDLGCGDGVLGLACQRLQAGCEITFLDESAQAVESARRNQKSNFPDREARFLWSDGLSDYDGPPFHGILCNPPFHQEHQIGDSVAWSLFSGAAHHLLPEGELVVVGNRHLDYHLKLKRLFSEVECLSRDPKFVVLRALRPNLR